MIWEHEDAYFSLRDAAVEFGLPKSYLKQLASSGEIPFLVVKGTMQFHKGDVRAALKALSERNAEVNREQLSSTTEEGA